MADALALPEAPEGFSWQIDGNGLPFLMDRAKNAAKAKAWRASQVAKRPVDRFKNAARVKAWRAAQVAKRPEEYRQAEAERMRRYRAECAAMEAITNQGE